MDCAWYCVVLKTNQSSRSRKALPFDMSDKLMMVIEAFSDQINQTSKTFAPTLAGLIFPRSCSTKRKWIVGCFANVLHQASNVVGIPHAGCPVKAFETFQPLLFSDEHFGVARKSSGSKSRAIVVEWKIAIQLSQQEWRVSATGWATAYWWNEFTPRRVNWFTCYLGRFGGESIWGRELLGGFWEGLL